MGIAAGIDKVIAAIAPQVALKRTVARQKMQILDSGYGNYGASVTKFQSTLPRGERHTLLPTRYLEFKISIHAPARGATTANAM